MKAYFDDSGALVIAAEDNTDMVALKAWNVSGGVDIELDHPTQGRLKLEWDYHLKTQNVGALANAAFNRSNLLNREN